MSEGYDLAGLEAWRAERDREFTDYASPLPDEDLERFTGLRYFPADPSLAVTGPEMINGVRASSIKTLSASSTMA